MLYNRIQYFVALLLAEFFQARSEGVILQRQYCNRIESGVFGTIYSHGCYGYAGRHLHYGEEGIQAVQGLALDRYADHRECGEGGNHTGQVCSTAGAGDNYFTTFRGSGCYIFGQGAGIAVSAEHLFFIRIGGDRGSAAADRIGLNSDDGLVAVRRVGTAGHQALQVRDRGGDAECGRRFGEDGLDGLLEGVRGHLNARVQMSPEALQKAVENILPETAASFGVSASIANLKCLMPGRPNPTYRYKSVI